MPMRGELFNTQLFKELATNPTFRVALYLLFDMLSVCLVNEIWIVIVGNESKGTFFGFEHQNKFWLIC